jgi:anti-sigma factor RsiW
MAEECPGREEQAAADRAIREALRGVPEPQLSPFFERRLWVRLARERLRKRSLRRWKRALQLYWLSAAVASAVILLRLPTGAHSLASSPVLLVTLGCGAILPGVILLAALRKDPIELVFEALDWLA